MLGKYFHLGKGGLEILAVDTGTDRIWGSAYLLPFGADLPGCPYRLLLHSLLWACFVI